jgi:hypothetical protein
MKQNPDETADGPNHPDWRLAAKLLRTALVTLSRSYGLTKNQSAVSALAFYDQMSSARGWCHDWHLCALVLFQACNKLIEGFAIADGNKLAGHAFENFRATVARRSIK